MRGICLSDPECPLVHWRSDEGLAFSGQELVFFNIKEALTNCRQMGYLHPDFDVGQVTCLMCLTKDCW